MGVILDSGFILAHIEQIVMVRSGSFHRRDLRNRNPAYKGFPCNTVQFTRLIQNS